MLLLKLRDHLVQKVGGDGIHILDLGHAAAEELGVRLVQVPAAPSHSHRSRDTPAVSLRYPPNNTTLPRTPS